MRSIFVKILQWFLITVLVCVAGIAITSEARNRFAPGRHDFFSRALAFEVNGARHAYETGGKAELSDYFGRLAHYFPGNYSLLNHNGIDVVTGQDRNAELPKFSSHWTPRSGSRMRIVWSTHDGAYRLLVDAASPPGPWSPIPYYCWIAIALLAFCYVLALQFASPLRTLEQAVERFGQGELKARAPSMRKDEFGKLARAFNVMADRIQLLLTAERRLLLDVSHELRSPLARLNFAVELARSSPNPRSFERIQKEVDRLSSLVAELLHVTRAETDPETRPRQEFALEQLVRDVVDDNELECGAHRCTLHVSAPEDVLIAGDPELLRRAIENVVRNAISYAPEGTPVEVRIERSNESAVVSVRDYGPGVPEAHLADLFKPFFRVEADRNRRSDGGVGLGLSIAERAVATHHGHMRAKNARPGLLVEIELPSARAAAAVS